MKIYSILIILSITLAFFSGRIAFMVGNRDQVTNMEVTFIHSLMQELQERVSPTYSINLREEYPKQSYLELLTPGALYKTDDLWHPNSTSCFDVINNRQSLSQLKKEDVWDSFRCNLISDLPENFFQTPPYIHTNGKSYAFMAFNFFPTKFRYTAWFRENVKYFQISELRAMPIELPPPQRFLVELDIGQIHSLVNGVRFFLTDKYLVINNGFLYFEAFPLKLAEIIFGRSGYQLANAYYTDECHYQMDLLCVNKRQEKLVDRLTETSILIFIAAVIILVMIASILYNKIRKQNLEEERKKHALRVLTHELRTPIASLLLQIENINADQEDLSGDVQEKLLRLESDVYRLKHLAEKSRDYLQSDSSDVVQFKSIEVESLNDFIQEVIEEIRTSHPHIKLEFHPAKDTSAQFDPYWIQICLANLIDNARRYGKGIIRVSTFVTGKFIEISVSDQGEIFEADLSKLLKKQSSESQGMGIGLKIVKKTLVEMGGDLILTTPPTTFTIKIPYKNKGENSNA